MAFVRMVGVLNKEAEELLYCAVWQHYMDPIRRIHDGDHKDIDGRNRWFSSQDVGFVLLLRLSYLQSFGLDEKIR
ncbi:hypothetical protein NDU88_010239 [Pleurodeles waltl]|uniref:Uncharacterized protein n=1 Tax=Pleurodeles waltl TaxID=8319 RepID=A0AAV7QTU6_PLEWA|nr:hypothetical protein NDU88_010239 [Pleurodeles waltl]